VNRASVGRDSIGKLPTGTLSSSICGDNDNKRTFPSFNDIEILKEVEIIINNPSKFRRFTTFMFQALIGVLIVIIAIFFLLNQRGSLPKVILVDEQFMKTYDFIVPTGYKPIGPTSIFNVMGIPTAITFDVDRNP